MSRMIHVALPEHTSHRLPFYLAMEEWIATSMPAGEWFFTWVVEPTVIFGRNQQPEKEVNLDYCRENGIQVYRRRSGGGCVYADRGNIMLSFVSSNPSPEEVTATFARYTGMIASMLRSLGLDARATGRNDVLIGGKKVSGNAFYHLPGGRSISHGTLLFSTDMAHMQNAITPSRAKLESKKVKSVESHITTVSEHLPDLTLAELEEFAIGKLTSGRVTLTPGQVKEIEAIEQRYYAPSWLWGASVKSRLHSRSRIEGVGEVAVYLTLHPEEGAVEEMEIHGDFFPLDDVSRLNAAFKGRRLRPEDIDAAMTTVRPDEVIAGLDSETLKELLLCPKI